MEAGRAPDGLIQLYAMMVWKNVAGPSSSSLRAHAGGGQGPSMSMSNGLLCRINTHSLPCLRWQRTCRRVELGRLRKQVWFGSGARKSATNGTRVRINLERNLVSQGGMQEPPRPQ